MRSNANNTGMDDLTYTYIANTNRLDKVADAAPDALPSEYERYNDIKKGQSTGNYQYDAIGNLTSDASEGISNIEWNVYGKIKSITKGSGTITYTYDAAGNRISKTANGKTAWYVRDATGNIMSIYEKGDTLKQKEINLYGSSRLGVYNVDIDVQTCNAVSPEVVTFTRGNKFFELTNHLGNVVVTVSDKKLQHTTNGTSIDHYDADVITAQDYYPGGMELPGRTFNSSLYRYSINGQEKTPEIAPNTITAKFWEYDSRIVRRWNIDPDVKPNESSYLCFGGNPIYHNDPDGDDYGITTKKDKNGKITNIKVSAKIYIQGDGASNKRAAELTKAAQQTYKTKTVDGVEVRFDVQYVYDPNKKPSDLKSKLGENLLTFTRKPENDNVFPRDVSHINPGYYIPFGRYNVEPSGNTGEIHNSGKVNYTILHESLHLLGLSDRYSETTGKPFPNYKNDIMGVYGKTTLSTSHYRNIIDFTQRQHELLLPRYPNLKYIYPKFRKPGNE